MRALACRRPNRLWRRPSSPDPFARYRGYSANVLNNGFCLMTQFYLNGIAKRMLTGGAREATPAEQIGSGFAAGLGSGVVCGPLELIMIQQQRKGGTILSVGGDLARGGPSIVSRGMLALGLREGIYCAGFMGILPAVRKHIRETYAHTPFGQSEDAARLTATFIAGPICAFASHPPDTVKTCMQGDIEQVRFKGYGQSAGVLVAESGIAALWRGMPWRLFRQCCAVFLFDKISAEVAPRLFPHAFR